MGREARLWRVCLPTLLALGLTVASCGPPEQGSGLWADPAEPRIAPADSLPAWPVQGDRLDYLDVRGQPRRAVVDGDHLLVPTGFGLRRLPRDGAGPGLEVPTPGTATSVVRVGDACWVADGARGVAVLGCADGLEWDRSEPLGTVRSLARAGDRVLATVREGALLVLEPDAEGRPRRVDRLVLDGSPVSVTVRQRGAGFDWLVGASEAGLVRGRLDARGTLRPTAVVQGPWVTRADFFDDGLLNAGSVPELWGSGLEVGTLPLPLPALDLAVDQGGAAWLAMGARGLARLEDGAGAEVQWIRSRPRLEARAVSIDPAGELLHVSWSDGRVEELTLDGSLVRVHEAGQEGRVRSVAPGFVGLYLGRDRGQLLPPDGAPALEVPAEIYDLEAVPGGALVAAEASGVSRIRRGPDGWLIEEVRRSVADAVAAGPDGSIWIADEIEGLVRVRPDGTEQVHRVWSGAETVTAAVSERWAVTTTYFASDLLAVDLAGGPPVRAILPGRPTGLVLDGDRVIVTMPLFGLGVVPLDRGDWPEADLLPLPWPERVSRSVLRVCGGPEQVLVMLDEVGVGVVDVPRGGTPALNRVIETPGMAVDCAPGEGGSWLIADGSSLLSLTLESGR